MRRNFAGLILLLLPTLASVSLRPVAAQQKTVKSGAGRNTTQDYLVYVVCEAADKIVLVRFGPHGAQIEHETHIGLMPTEINGPHGIAVSLDKEFIYVTVGHGRPDGSVWKLKAGTDQVMRYKSLGLFPATADISRDGEFLYVANANFHGDIVPSSISVVATGEMIEVKRITTCTMPHGSRLNPQGTRHYSACMMDDMLAEIDTQKFEVSRHFILSAGKEMAMAGAPHEQMKMGELTCVPTWAQPSNDGSEVYVACNKSNEIVAMDVASWKVARRFAAGTGVYNLAMTKDGRLVATNKRGQSVSVFDPKTGKELARLPTKRKVVHGAVVSPDNRYAFISVEGIGSDPGTLEVIDLDSLKTVATVDLPPQAAGVDFWKMEPNKSQ
ncbi:MAG TPA: beta-propeller fold lactonase family protein [Candidatus Limnocylindria bacterium]|nr:beta-propeller fold lactonase family protein [Candidatus Limnocylindria bacterium]